MGGISLSQFCGILQKSMYEMKICFGIVCASSAGMFGNMMIGGVLTV